MTDDPHTPIVGGPLSYCRRAPILAEPTQGDRDRSEEGHQEDGWQGRKPAFPDSLPTCVRTAERRNASEPPVFGELSTGCRNYLAWAPTAAERNNAVSRPRMSSDAERARDPKTKADLLDLARQWLALAAEAKHEAP